MGSSTQRQLDNSKARAAKLSDEIKALKKERTSLQKEVRSAVAAERGAKKALVQAQTTIKRLEDQLEERGITPSTRRGR